MSLAFLHVYLDWRTPLDLLLVTLGLFLIYRTLSRLGAWSILLGILVAGTLFFLARLLQLRAVDWVYSNLSSVALIAIIVIFQPELRKFFERMVSFRLGNHQEDAVALALMVTEAVSRLATLRWGALLVFPGKESLHRWLSSGVELRATPSLPLLVSLFDPHSPGHDGAVVIEKNQVTFFGVRLPLSQSDRLSPELGTRHHAAMGLSEASDALVLAISEEQGTVRVFSDGHMELVNDSKDALPSLILAHWHRTSQHRPSQPRKHPRWHRVVEVCGCGLLALLFWMTTVNPNDDVRTVGFSVPIEYLAVPAGLAFANDIPTEVKLYLTGTTSVLDQIRPSQLRLQVDLSEAAAGPVTIPVTSQLLHLPRGVELLDSVPPTLELGFTQLQIGTFQIEPNWVGTLPEGLEMNSVVIDPASMQVLYPEGQVPPKHVLMTNPIFLGDIKESTHLQKNVAAVPGLKPVEGKWPTVDMQLEVRAQLDVDRRLNALTRTIQETLPDVSVTRETRGVRLGFGSLIEFPSNQSTLTEDSERILASLAMILSQHGEDAILIEGHTDSNGSEENNLQISQQRAQAVVSYLATQGIASVRLSAMGYGESVPIDTNDTVEGRRANRRIEMVVTPSLSE